MDRPPLSQSIPSFPPGVRLLTLDHGLTLILKEDTSAPVVSAQAWCQAGSIDEGAWLGAGLSHVLEHMLFKGTSTRGAGRIDQEIQSVGGYMNAYTSFDRTVYWINVPNSGARVALDVLCDIMQHATLPAEEMEKEKEVILREMDMNHDDPGQRSARRLFETAYTKSPYRYPIIGYPDIYHAVQREDVMAYYRQQYAPNNLFFVVVGDIRTEEVEAQIRQAFAQAKARPLPPRILPEEPRQMAPRERVEEAPIELGHLHFSWHIPNLRHPDVPVLDVLATLLGGGRSSRLFQQVRERKGLTHSVDAWTYSPGNPGLFGLSAVLDGARYAEATQAMLEEVERMKAQPVSPQELIKAVKQFTAATLANRKTMQGQAQDLGGNWIATADLSFSARYLEAVKRITPADLQRVAGAYLTEENRTLFALLPDGTAPRSTILSEVSARSPIRKLELPNGLRVLVKEDHRLPFVELRAVFKGGVLTETPDDNGQTLLMTKMLLQGSERRSAEQIATEIESVGGHLDCYAANNSFGLSLEVLRDDLATGLDLLQDVLLHPAFPEGPLERERQIQLAGIRAQRDELLASAFQLMRRGLFGPATYGLQALGTEGSVTRLQSPSLRTCHERLARPNNCVLVAFGDIELPAFQEAISRRFGDWQSGAPVLEPLPDPPAPGTRRRLTEHRDKKQAVVVLGFHGCSVSQTDRYALEIVQEACSDLGSRLFLRIRDELGLAYYVGAQNMLGLIPGFFAFYAGTAPQEAARVEEELVRQAQRLAEEGLTEEELQRAKAKIIGQRKIARQDLGSYAMAVGLDELYGLGFQNHEREDACYEAVDLQEVQQVARAHLRMENSVTALIQPAETPA